MKLFLQTLFKKMGEKRKKPQSHEPYEANQEAFRENPYSVQPEEQPENLLRPKLKNVKTIKKKLVYTLVLLFGVIFVISFMYSKKSKEIPEGGLPNNTSYQQTDTIDKPMSYAELMGKQGVNPMNPNQKQNPRVNNGVNMNGQEMQSANNLNPVPNLPYRENTRYGNTASMNYPSTPTPGYGYVPYVNPFPQGGSQASQANSENSAKKENYLRSAIGFALGTASGNSNGNQGSAAPVGYYSSSTPQNVLSAGSMIPVTLLNGIDSDLPSQVVCQVRENVYDSFTGEMLLIPQGAKVIGEVNNGTVGTAQERIAVNWKRLILPNGVSVNLGSMPGVDNSGYPGLHDRVNNHEGKVIGATMLTSLMSAAAQIAAGNTSSSNDMSASQLAISGASANILNAGAKMLEKNINVSPTIQISPGTVFNIFVTQDLILRPYE